MAIQGNPSVQSTLINGNRYSYQSIDVYMFGIPVVKGPFQKLDYTGTMSAELVQGNQVAPVGKTPGYGKVEGSFTILADVFDDFIQQVFTNNNTFPMLEDWDMTIIMSIGDSFTRQDQINGIRITSIQQTKGDKDTIVFECSFIASQLNINGQILWDVGGTTP